MNWKISLLVGIFIHENQYLRQKDNSEFKKKLSRVIYYVGNNQQFQTLHLKETIPVFKYHCWHNNVIVP